jgi:hypothetical protein
LSGSASGTEKDDQDGSFLIIDNSTTVDAIPDTAVQLFDKPKTISSSEISFFSEPLASNPVNLVEESSKTMEDVSSTKIAFFDEPIVITESSIAPESSLVPEIKTESPDLITFSEEVLVRSSQEIIAPIVVEQIFEPVQEEVKVANIITPVVVEVTKEEIIQGAYVPEENDIYAPMKRAIAEYDTLLIARTQISDAIDNKIAENNARIAEEKAAAKKNLEERKVLETGTNQIKQMRDTLFAQIK